MAVDLGRKIIFGLHKPTQNLIEEEQKMLTNQQNNKIMKSTRLFSSRLGNQAFYLTSRVNSRLLRELRQPWPIIALFFFFVLFCLPYQPTFIRGTMMGKQWSYLNREMQYPYTLMVSLDLFLRQLLCTNPLARGPPPLASSSRSERNCGHFLAMYGLLPIWSKVKNCQKNNNKQGKTKGTLYRKTSVTTNPRYLTFEMENFL